MTFDGITYRVYDFGRGGDCDANSIWIMETEPKVAFVGDLVFNGMHSYMADDAILAWLVNLERAGMLLADVPTIYPGHGQPGPLTLLESQKAYLLAYCVAVRELADRKPTLTETARQELVARMERFLPGVPLTFLITHSADAVAAELARSNAFKRVLRVSCWSTRSLLYNLHTGAEWEQLPSNSPTLL